MKDMELFSKLDLVKEFTVKLIKMHQTENKTTLQIVGLRPPV